MEVGEECLHGAKDEARPDKEVGLAVEGAQLPRLRSGLEGPHGGGPDRDHAPSPLASRRHCIAQVLRNVNSFGMKTLPVHDIFPQGRKGAGSDVEGEADRLDSRPGEPCEHRLVEMQARGRRCDRTRLGGVDGLVPYLVRRIGVALDVGRQREAPVTSHQAREVVALDDFQ